MRPCDSAYDRRHAGATISLLEALAAVGYRVHCVVTGSVLVDGTEIPSADWGRLVAGWDGTAEGLEDLGF